MEVDGFQVVTKQNPKSRAVQQHVPVENSFAVLEEISEGVEILEM